MKTTHRKIIALQLGLIVASVMVFRGLWLLFDMCPLFDEKWALAVMLIGGLGLSGYFLKKIHNQE